MPIVTVPKAALSAGRGSACTHIQEFISRNGLRDLSAILKYRAVCRHPADKTRSSCCSVFCARHHACLECVFVGCWTSSHIHEHMQLKGHTFAIDLMRLHTFCFACNDYIYHPQFASSLLPTTPHIQSKRSLSSHSLITGRSAALAQQREAAAWHFSLSSDKAGLRGLRGLLNLGNTCFMNVVLQTLVHNPMIRDYFLGDRHNNQRCPSSSGGGESPSQCLGCDMDLIFQSLFSGETIPFAPEKILCAMWSHAAHLADYQQQDAHEFLISLLDGLHQKCGGTTTDCKCIVHQTFGGRFRSVVTCLSCSEQFIAFDPLLEIAVDLSIVQSSHNLLPQTLFDCFDRFTQPERLSDKFLCRRCNAPQRCDKQLSIHTLPPVLTIHLKRFKHMGHLQAHSTKIDSYISFPVDNLDLSRYLSPLDGSPVSDAPSSLYKLFAVVEHKGSTETGHYIAYVRRGDEWFKCDDAMITRKPLRDVISSHAYMLFYMRSAG